MANFINSRAWQYVFFILAGLSLFPVVGGVLSIPPEPSRKDNGNRRVDWMGAFLITAGLSLFSFALTQSGLVEKGWRTPCKSSYLNYATGVQHSLRYSCRSCHFHSFDRSLRFLGALRRKKDLHSSAFKACHLLSPAMEGHCHLGCLFLCLCSHCCKTPFLNPSQPSDIFPGLDVPHNYLVPELQTRKRSHERRPHLARPCRRCHSLCACSPPCPQDSSTISFDVWRLFHCCCQLALSH